MVMHLLMLALLPVAGVMVAVGGIDAAEALHRLVWLGLVPGALAMLVVDAPVGTATADLLLARFLNASGEAFLTGMLTAIFVAFRPEWLATYSDQLYLPKDRPGEH